MLYDETVTAGCGQGSKAKTAVHEQVGLLNLLRKLIFEPGNPRGKLADRTGGGPGFR